MKFKITLMKTHRPIILYFMFFLLLSCTKEEITTMKGDIVGFINLIDEKEIELENRSGVRVSIENTSWSATSNKIGRYELKNVSAGCHNVIYEKEGYGTYRLSNYEFVGGNKPAVINSITLYEIPTNIEIYTVDAVYEYEFNVLTISGTMSETDKYAMRIFFNDSADVSNTHFDYSTSFSYCCISTTTFYCSVYLPYTPFLEGETVYFVIYLYNTAEPYLNFSYLKATDIIEFKIE